MIRIFERPYYSFNFYEDDLAFYNFEYFTSSLWFVIITMSSVGYGGVIASTPVGRGITIVTAIIGAFLLSLLVAIITDWFVMDETKAEAISTMQKDRFAVAAVRTAFQYNVARAKRYKLLLGGNEDNDHIPTVEELSHLKQQMYAASDAYRNFRRQEFSQANQDELNKKRDL